MEIKREIPGGKEIRITLTQNELERAYYEAQEMFDREDITYTIVDDMAEEDFTEYGFTREEVMPLIPRMARLFRYYWEKVEDLDPQREVQYDAIYDILKDVRKNRENQQ